MSVRLQLSNSNIVLFLILIIIISLGLKLYLIDFSLPVYADNLDYTMMAIAHTNGDFTQSSHRGMGWSIFVSSFFSLIDSNSFIDYSNTIRILSIAVATSTIPMMYLVGRKFFDARYSLLLASLFAFEPHLNYNSGLGLSEPLLHLIIITSFYFILNKNTRFVIISLFFAGIAYWIRINGIFVVIVITVIYFITLRKSPNLFRNYGLGVVLFLLVISPILLERYEEFGDPFYSDYKDKIFAGSIEDLYGAVDDQNLERTATDYIENQGVGAFIQTFILQGFYNSLKIISVLSFPYLFILIPFGIIFSFRAFDQNSSHIKANWILILISLASLVLVISIVPEKRYMMYLLPFLMIFSVIPIQRVTEYGLNTFSFSRKQKDIFIIGVIITVILLSSIFTARYGAPDYVFENEKLQFSEYAINNFHGNYLREFGPATDYFLYQAITDQPIQFKQHKITTDYIEYQELDNNEAPLDSVFISGKSLSELIKNGKELELKYIITKDDNQPFHVYLNDLYLTEEKYPYMTKVFDSDEFGFKKLKIKVFEIDYEKFHDSER